MKLTKEQIQKIYSDAVRNMSLSTHLLEKSMFEAYLSGLNAKLLKVKSAESEKQQQTIQWMLSWLSRQYYLNTINIVQSRMITDLENMIVKLEFEKEELLKENINLKQNI
jgi:hypothetical protein